MIEKSNPKIRLEIYPTLSAFTYLSYSIVMVEHEIGIKKQYTTDLIITVIQFSI